MQERWRMNKLGFVNFWLYDWEEFPFSEGRLLLRGENGAGKSVTTQSFIPFMLDGDLRPYRLDSFGSKDRKMAYYLLGEEKEESTGYLYLEFIKPEHRLYRTLVVGLRARRSSSTVEFWGFCLSDGRRIGTGPEDFALFETKGSQHISLTRQEVHNRFGDGENWVERGSDYKQMVNRMLFGCAEMEQYDRLLRLLIQLRKPKLSKDFSPRLVQEILNASLQPLSEEDIAPMVNSMEKMDTIQHRLEALGQSLQEARQLRNEYTRYNQYVLGKKGQYYLAARQFTQQRQTEVKSLEDKVALTQQALEEARASHQEAEQQVGELSRQLEVLREGSDLDSAVRRKEECRRQAAQQQEAVEREQREEQRKQNALDAKERERLQAECCCADQQELLERNFRELAEQNEELRYPRHPADLQAVDFRQEQPEIASFAIRLRKAAELLRRKAEALQQLDRYQQDQDDAAQALSHAQTEWEEARRTVGAMRDELSEAFAVLEEPTQAFRLRHEEVTALFAQVTAYEGLAQEQEMQKILNGALQRLSMPLVQEHTLWEQQQKDSQQQLNELAVRRRELENQKDLPPERSEAVQATRAYLQERGVPHASFYELVDFAPDLPPGAVPCWRHSWRMQGFSTLWWCRRKHGKRCRNCWPNIPIIFFVRRTCPRRQRRCPCGRNRNCRHGRIWRGCCPAFRNSRRAMPGLPPTADTARGCCRGGAWPGSLPDISALRPGGPTGNGRSRPLPGRWKKSSKNWKKSGNVCSRTRRHSGNFSRPMKPAPPPPIWRRRWTWPPSSGARWNAGNGPWMTARSRSSGSRNSLPICAPKSCR